MNKINQLLEWVFSKKDPFTRNVVRLRLQYQYSDIYFTADLNEYLSTMSIMEEEKIIVTGILKGNDFDIFYIISK